MMNTHDGNKLKWENLTKQKVWDIDNYRNEKLIIISSVG